MTNEEIQSRIKEIDESLAKTPDEKTLSGSERRKRLVLTWEKDTLERIKRAREKGNIQEEVKCLVSFAALKSIKNPWLLYLVQMKFRSHIYS